MLTFTDAPAGSGVSDPEPGARGPLDAQHPSRWWHFGTSLALMLTWPIGLGLFIVWAVVASLSLLTVVAPLLLPVAAMIRGYAQAHRRWAGRALGRQVTRPETGHGRRAPATLFGTFTIPLRDAAIWREWLWLLVHATVGFALALIPTALLLSALFYSLYPLLFALTPQEVFGTVFGFIEIHSVSEAWLVTPIAVVCLGLWLATARSLPTAYARIITMMIAARPAGDPA